MAIGRGKPKKVGSRRPIREAGMQRRDNLEGAEGGGVRRKRKDDPREMGTIPKEKARSIHTPGIRIRRSGRLRLPPSEAEGFRKGCRVPPGNHKLPQIEPRLHRALPR